MWREYYYLLFNQVKNHQNKAQIIPLSIRILQFDCQQRRMHQRDDATPANNKIQKTGAGQVANAEVNARF